MKRLPLTLLAAAALLVSIPAAAYIANLAGNTPEEPPARSPSVPVAGALTPVPPGKTRAPAPIDGLSVRIAESHPPQYFADVTYGLPNGCTGPGGYQLHKTGNEVRIEVVNLVPADPSTICTMIYGSGTHAVPLGSDFTSGQTYTVIANNKRTTFTAQ